MAMRRAFHILLAGLSTITAIAGCGPLVKVDVDCKRLCLDAQGPTIPALANRLPPAIHEVLAIGDGGVMSWDGGLVSLASLAESLDGAAIEGAPAMPTVSWTAEVAFDKVLAQLPSAAAGLSADVRLTSIALRSTTALDFVESIEVTLRRPAAVAASPSKTGDSAARDGGGNRLDCRAQDYALRVAYYQRAEGEPPAGTIDLTMVAPDINLFDCMKNAPARFEVELLPRMGVVSLAAAPLTLGTCIGAATHVSYP